MTARGILLTSSDPNLTGTTFRATILANAMSASHSAITAPKTSPPVWFWVIFSIALLWFLMDASAFVMRVLMTEEGIRALPENQQHLYREMPRWVNVVFAGEALGGLLGSAALLLRKTWALPLFAVSILGVLAQTFHIYFQSDAIATMGAPAIVMPMLSILIGAGMIALARSSISKGWLK